MWPLKRTVGWPLRQPSGQRRPLGFHRRNWRLACLYQSVTLISALRWFAFNVIGCEVWPYGQSLE